VLGAFIVCFRKPVDEVEMGKVKELLECVGEVVKEGCGYGWDGVCLAVGMLFFSFHRGDFPRL